MVQFVSGFVVLEPLDGAQLCFPVSLAQFAYKYLTGKKQHERYSQDEQMIFYLILTFGFIFNILLLSTFILHRLTGECRLFYSIS